MENPEVSQTNKHGRLSRIRNEVAIEIVLVVVGFTLAFGLTTKIVLAITVSCIKFAIPDWITAWLVLRSDPDHWYGKAVTLLFVAIGFTKASIFAFIVFFAMLGVTILLRGPGGQLWAVGFGSGFLCAYGFLAVVFPLCLAASIIAWKTDKKLEFAAGLTKLRRSAASSRLKVDLDVWKGLKLVGVSSGLSLTVTLIVPMTVVHNIIPFLLAFVSPFIWMPIFWSITVPKR